MIKKSLLLAVAISIPTIALGQGYAEHEQAAGFIDEMVQEHAFERQQVLDVLAAATRQQAILDAISRPAERVRPWKEYRQIFLTPQRLQRGLEFWQQHVAALARAEQDYGVAPEYIVAIIGVETMYGGNTGRYSVLDALATLGFDYPPRQDFFRRQLREFFLLTREQDVDPASLTGSYAGAMGLAQFMPGSYRAYAVDFNADGKIDIWHDAEDAIGSVANYFVEHGWQPQAEVTVQAWPQHDKALELVSTALAPQHTVTSLQEQGWQLERQVAGDEPATLFALEADDGMQYWLGLPNFETITRYNRSNMYAMAVQQLAQQLRAEYEAQQND